MKRKWKILIGVVLLILVAGGAIGGYKYSKRGIVTVQTGKVARQDLAAIVTASGEIKPRNYINIGSNTMGPAKIVDIYVKEGDKVRKNQVVAKLDSIQAQADAAAQKAAVNSALADSTASEAAVNAAEDNIRTSEASLERSKADYDRAKIEFNRSDALFKEKLVAKQDWDQKKSAVEAAQAAINEAQARIAQAKAQRQQIAAQLSATQRRVAQVQAGLRRSEDVLDKYNAYSPIDGVVTNLPVRVGETVVPGIQNSPASTIMTDRRYVVDHGGGEGG